MPLNLFLTTVLCRLNVLFGHIMRKWNCKTKGKLIRMDVLIFGFQSVALVWNWLMDHLVFMNLLFSVFIIFFQRREPKSVWAWLLLLYFVPVVGFVFYLVIGQDMHKSKMFRTKEIEDEVNTAIRRQEEIIYNRELEEVLPFLKNYSDLILYNLESSGAVLTDDNAIEVYTDGHDKFQALIEAIRQAKDYIHMEYYIFRKDELFEQIKEALLERARAGVEVRILFDSMGCRSMGRRVWRSLEQEGIKVAEFFPAALRRLHLRINYRNHRKIVVIDGVTGFVGGFNVGREYLGLDEKMGYWRDTHLQITGSAVGGLNIRFMKDWTYASGENLFVDNKYLIMPEKVQEGGSSVQIVSSGPDSAYPNVRNNYLWLISRARKRIYIQTPYFIPDESILSALRIAALSGVDVRVMIPCKPDHPFVYWATYSYIGDMVAVGARCYTYDNGFLHAKGMVVDGEVYCYGTANMDIRSFEVNFEVNATVYDSEAAAQMEMVFLNDLEHCTEITPMVYAGRGLFIRLKEQVCRLMSPLL